MKNSSVAAIDRSFLFSSAHVKVSRGDTARMAALIEAVQRVVALPAYREYLLAGAPEIARHVPPNPGAFYGYDFHLSPTGPKLIEINTNAGGGLLAARRFGRADVGSAVVERRLKANQFGASADRSCPHFDGR